jgi:3-dehydroshikimate dehydratase
MAGNASSHTVEMDHLIPGLVSITFRELPPREVIALAAAARLRTIEWGGDNHVPLHDFAHAKAVARLTREEGLSVAAYGSYYRLGQKEAKGASFEAVLETAVALGAPTIRVWAGTKGAKKTTPAERREIVHDALRVVSLAKALSITVSLEYHDGTLTDDADSVRLLMTEIAFASRSR